MLLFFLLSACNSGEQPTTSTSNGNLQPAPAAAKVATDIEQLREIRLDDGSLIKGKLIFTDGKSCKIETQTMGIVEIPMSKIETIQKPGASKATAKQQTTKSYPRAAVRQEKQTAPAPQASAKPKSSPPRATQPTTTAQPEIAIPSTSGMTIKMLKKAMMSDPTTHGQIMNLASDPEIKAVLSDPELMNLIQSGNLAALQKHPKMKQLMRNPSIRKLVNAMKQ